MLEKVSLLIAIKRVNLTPFFVCLQFENILIWFLLLGTEIGTVLTIASANDVDTYPSLAYSFDEVHTDEDALALFSIDRFSGKVLLKKPLDYEMRQEYQLRIFASDSKYKAQSTLTIHITDENDNAPEFSQLLYQSTISGKFFKQRFLF